MEIRSTRFRINSMSFFLTFPQADTALTNAEVLENLDKLMLSKGRRVVAAVVGLENHEEEGGIHFHLAFKLDKKLDIKNANYFDCLTGKHGNYQSARRWKEVVKYCTKDGNYSTFNVDVEAIVKSLKKKTSSKFEQLAMKIIEEKPTYIDFLTENPGFCLQHGRKIKEFIEDCTLLEKGKKEPWPGIKVTLDMDYSHLQIAEWLNDNLFKEREHKQKQLWIWGPTGNGKTYLWDTFLEKYCNIFIIPDDDRFMGKWRDNQYDLAIFDEYKGQKTMTWLNQWLEGSQMKLCEKGFATTTKKQRIPTIICSNYPPHMAYSKTSLNDLGLKAFVERLIVVELTTKLNLEVNPINNPVPLNVPVEIIENNQVIENNVLKSPIHLPQMELSNDDLSATLTGDDFTRKLHCNETLRQTQPESEEAILEPWEDDSLDWDPQFYVNTKDKKPEFVPLPSALKRTHDSVDEYGTNWQHFTNKKPK